jgi:hypothetical protein
LSDRDTWTKIFLMGSYNTCPKDRHTRKYSRSLQTLIILLHNTCLMGSVKQVLSNLNISNFLHILLDCQSVHISSHPSLRDITINNHQQFSLNDSLRACHSNLMFEKGQPHMFIIYLTLFLIKIYVLYKICESYINLMKYM